MTESARLRDRVLEAICTGRLPVHSPKRTWAGPGSGARCVIFDQRVKADEVEFELEFATGDDGNGREGCHVHRGCFLAWDSERRELALSGGA